MKVYVAGKTHQYEKVRRVQKAFTRFGHTITFDWTQTVEVNGPDSGHDFEELTPEFKRECAENDLLGVTSCELLVALIDDPRIMGTMAEFGIAAGLYKEIWLIGKPERDSVFFYLPQVKEHFDTVTQFLDRFPNYVEDLRTYGPGFPD